MDIGYFFKSNTHLELAASAFLATLLDGDEAFRRAAIQGGRPLVEKGETDVASLYAERKDKYSRAHATVDTTRLSPEEVVQRVLRLLTPP